MYSHFHVILICVYIYAGFLNSCQYLCFRHGSFEGGYRFHRAYCKDLAPLPLALMASMSNGYASSNIERVVLCARVLGSLLGSTIPWAYSMYVCLSEYTFLYIHISRVCIGIQIRGPY